MSEQNAPAAAAPVVENTQTPAPATQENKEASASGEQPNAQTAKDQIADAVKNGATKEEVKELIKEFQLKVNGKNITKKINLNDEKELIRELQLAAAGREAMNESAELKKLFASELNRLKEDPWAVMEELGLNPDELAELRIQKRIEEMSKSPEQKQREALENERADLQKQLEEARSKLKDKDEREAQLQREKYESDVAVDLENQIMTALDAHKDISASPKVVNRIADTMLWAMENGFDDVSPEDVIPTVRKEMRAEINDVLNSLPEEVLEEFIGQKNIDRLRKKRLEAAKKAKSVNTISNAAPKTSAEEKKTEEPKKKTRLEDFMRLY